MCDSAEVGAKWHMQQVTIDMTQCILFSEIHSANGESLIMNKEKCQANKEIRNHRDVVSSSQRCDFFIKEMWRFFSFLCNRDVISS